MKQQSPTDSVDINLPFTLLNKTLATLNSSIMQFLNLSDLHIPFYLNMFTNRNEANGMYANKDLFAVDESVQREALKNFYEQRAGVKIIDAYPWLTNLKNIRLRRRN